MAEKNSFVFYRSFYEAIDPLPEKERLELYDAITKYALNQKQPELSGISKAFFTLIKPQLEASHVKFLNGSKGKGKAKRKQIESKTEAKPERNANNSNSNSNSNLNDNYNIKGKLQYGTVLEVEAMRTGFDIDFLYGKFDRWILDKDKPKNPDSAFMAWVKKFTKGKAA